MSSDRQIVRLMAAMILAIIAYVAPSAVQARESHAHHGHHAMAAPAAVAMETPEANVVTVRASSPAQVKVALAALTGEPTAPIQADGAGAGCHSGACKGSCCGTMVCCASGILSGPVSLEMPAFRPVRLTPYDVAGRPGIGPEALPKPPRTLA